MGQGFLFISLQNHSMHFFFFTQHPCLIVHTLGEEKDIVAQKPRKVREKEKKKEKKNKVSKHI
jgi:hypothetical protein